MKNETRERRKNIVNIMSQNEEFIIIGLTGRVGSGCSEAAEIFGSTYQQLELPLIQPGIQGLRNNEERDLRILQRYAGAHWLKFDIIRVRTIISVFLLEEFTEFTKAVAQLESHPTDEEALKEKMNSVRDELFSRMYSSIQKKYYTPEKKEESIDWQAAKEMIREKMKDLSEYGNIKEDDDQEVLSAEDFLCYGVKTFQRIGDCYPKVDFGQCMEQRSRYLGRVEKVLSEVSGIVAACLLGEYQSEEIWKALCDINTNLVNVPLENNGEEQEQQSIDRLKMFVFVHDLMPCLGDAIHDYMQERRLPFTELFQKYGNSIRCYGKVCYGNTDNIPKSADVFAIPRRIVRFVKALRHPFPEKNSRPVRIVIDSIKNVFEATYLRQRYSSFYLFAISADESIRTNRLMNSEKKSLTMEQIRFIDWNEYSSEGAKIYNQVKQMKENHQDLERNCTDAERKFFESIEGHPNEDAMLTDYVRKEAYNKNLQQFYLQDVAASIDNADVFISNNYVNEIEKNMHLLWAIVRNVCLIMFPGLLLPTPIEQCMQIAFAAKCNSGCLSRQVGAVVTDAEYNVLSIGCNDVPCGDVSCARKNLVDLCKSEDSPAYTKYELTNPEFRKQIMRFQYKAEKLGQILRGLPMRYCFKDLHQKDKTKNKNPMRSRAMHAEEKALSACGERCAGGYLFTTSSPCEMCSKNAKNHRIKKIYYIEVYPGISEEQYSGSGDPTNIAEHILFTGAIGRAYVQMYTPIMPQKDVLELLGVYDEYWS